MAETTTTNTGRRPDLEDQMAGVKIAGWFGKFGWSFKINERSYQSDGKWVQTPYFRTADLIILHKLIDRMIDRALSAPAPAAGQEANGDPPAPI